VHVHGFDPVRTSIQMLVLDANLESDPKDRKFDGRFLSRDLHRDFSINRDAYHRLESRKWSIILQSAYGAYVIYQRETSLNAARVRVSFCASA